MSRSLLSTSFLRTVSIHHPHSLSDPPTVAAARAALRSQAVPAVSLFLVFIFALSFLARSRRISPRCRRRCRPGSLESVSSAATAAFSRYTTRGQTRRPNVFRAQPPPLPCCHGSACGSLLQAAALFLIVLVQVKKTRRHSRPRNERSLAYASGIFGLTDSWIR